MKSTGHPVRTGQSHLPVKSCPEERECPNLALFIQDTVHPLPLGLCRLMCHESLSHKNRLTLEIDSQMGDKRARRSNGFMVSGTS